MCICVCSKMPNLQVYSWSQTVIANKCTNSAYSSVHNLTLPPINDGLIKQMYNHIMKFYVVIYKVTSSKKNH